MAPSLACSHRRGAPEAVSSRRLEAVRHPAPTPRPALAGPHGSHRAVAVRPQSRPPNGSRCYRVPCHRARGSCSTRRNGKGSSHADNSKPGAGSAVIASSLDHFERASFSCVIPAVRSGRRPGVSRDAVIGPDYGPGQCHGRRSGGAAPSAQVQAPCGEEKKPGKRDGVSGGAACSTARCVVRLHREPRPTKFRARSDRAVGRAGCAPAVGCTGSRPGAQEPGNSRAYR